MHAGAGDSSPILRRVVPRVACKGTRHAVHTIPGALRPARSSGGGSSPPPWSRASSVKRSRFIFYGASNLGRLRRRFVAADLRRQREIAGVDVSANERTIEFCQTFCRDPREIDRESLGFVAGDLWTRHSRRVLSLLPGPSSNKYDSR